VDFINPLFENDKQKEKQKYTRKVTSESNRIRKKRADATRNIKFPVDQVYHMKLRTLFKQALAVQKRRGDAEHNLITQTKFNTLLLRYGLGHQNLITWNNPYKDTKKYFHTYILETEYPQIGGPYGLSILKQVSDRQVVYHIVTSIVDWLERSGNYDEIL
jgi:hypothetical protein